MMTKHQTPSSLLLLTTLLSSTLIMLTSTNWIMMWLGMEMNLMSMIPLMNTSKNPHEIEASIKYFIMQATSSTLLLTAMIMYLSATLPKMSTILIMSALMMKLGMVPFHIWLPHVLNGITWPVIIIITTWQKIGPLAIMAYTISMWNSTLFLIMVSLSAMVGAINGISQTQMRPLIAYSSISHMAWMMASSSLSSSLTLVYLSLYSIITIMLILPIMAMSKTTTSEFNISTQFPSNQSTTTMLTLLSMAGMPPLLGFIPKWLVILHLTKVNVLMSLILIISSLISLFFYLALFFASTLNITKPLKLKLAKMYIPYLVPMNISLTAISLIFI